MDALYRDPLYKGTSGVYYLLIASTRDSNTLLSWQSVTRLFCRPVNLATGCKPLQVRLGHSSTLLLAFYDARHHVWIRVYAGLPA